MPFSWAIMRRRSGNRPNRRYFQNMYTAILATLLALAGLVLFRGFRSRHLPTQLLGFGMAGLTIMFFQYIDFWGELLWFQAMGYASRFWMVVLGQLALGAAGALSGATLMFLLTLALSAYRRRYRWVAVGIGTLVGAFWGYTRWLPLLQWWHRTDVGLTEPFLGLDAGFYLFTLPLLDQVYGLLTMLSLIALVITIAAVYLRQEGDRQYSLREPTLYDIDAHISLRALYVAMGALLLVLAGGQWLERYHLLFSPWGAVYGPGWTDTYVRLPARVAMAGLLAMAGIFMLLPMAHRWLSRLPYRWRIATRQPHTVALGLVIGTLGLWWLLTIGLLPGAMQVLRVEPNEITFEAPFIVNNIKYTRQGFGLADVEDSQFETDDRFDRQVVNDNRQLLSNIRLWDWRALSDVFRQFQVIRLYYEFGDVDVDRYRLGDDYQQVMIAVREMEIDNLPDKSQTFVNRRFKYTHGFGVAITSVNEFTQQGLPKFLMRDIPPVASHEALQLTQPRIYYGERTRSHVIVNSTESEFDYPAGEENAYTRYEGRGGVPLSNVWRKFVYGYKFDGTSLFLSGYPNRESRIMFHRQIQDRVQTLAPFLEFDRDPYPVVADGRVYWIIDAYTTSAYYPYSEPMPARENLRFQNEDLRPPLPAELRASFTGKNYVRNSVKAVVDAYDGTVQFYIFDDEPLIRVWSRIFPDLFQPRSAMPAALQAHVRYPEDFLFVQSLVYSKYHMEDPVVFYNQEDLWIRATEKYYDRVQPVDPYYVMWQLPGQSTPEFVLIQPFTPKNRQVLAGWIAGRSDGEHYGKLLAYRFPKQSRVLGPQQVETKIDQDGYLSGQLSLWNQRGSSVIRGNLLAIPIANTVLYVEPIYLQAETAAYPELRLVAMVHEDKLSYAPTFEAALEGLIGEPPELPRLSGNLPDTQPDATVAPQRTQIAQAKRAFDDYLAALGAQDFEGSARALRALQTSLEDLEIRTDTATVVPATDTLGRSLPANTAR